MAKKIEEKKGKAAGAEKDYGEVFTKKNKVIIAAGILMIVLGFYALAQPPVNGFLTMKLAPFLLVTALMVVIPIGIMYRDKKEE